MPPSLSWVVRSEPVCDGSTQVGRRTPGDPNRASGVEVVVALEDVGRILDRIDQSHTICVRLRNKDVIANADVFGQC